MVSGNDPAAEEPSRAVLDALLEGKAQWGSNMQVRAQDHVRIACGAVPRGRGKVSCVRRQRCDCGSTCSVHGSVMREIS